MDNTRFSLAEERWIPRSEGIIKQHLITVVSIPPRVLTVLSLTPEEQRYSMHLRRSVLVFASEGLLARKRNETCKKMYIPYWMMSFMSSHVGIPPMVAVLHTTNNHHHHQ